MNATGAPRSSHIHTPEWQSFEMRMRARIEERKAARRRRRLHWALGLAVPMLGGLSAVGVTLFLLSGDRTPPPAAAAPPPAVMSSLAAIPTPVFEDALPESGPVDEVATGTAGSDAPVEPATQEPVARAVEPEPEPPPAPPPAPRPRPAAARTSALEATPPAPTTRDAPPQRITVPRFPERVPDRVADRVPEQPAPEPEVVAAAEPAAASGAPAYVAVPTSAAASAPPSSPPVVDPRAPVQHTIERYRTAYERLDADAARAVWPTVDRGALARAFSSLSAQQLTFDGCTIDVTDGTARANCRGRARVVPRVGGGSETARREWNFWLRQGNGGWVIERTEVR